MSNALAVESRVLRHSPHHCHGHNGQIQPEKIIGYVNRTNHLEFWDTEAMFHDKSSDPETVSYCYMLSTWVVSTWDWAPLPCAQALADNCLHFLASRYIWGVKGTCFHQLDFWKSFPHLVVDLWLREQNKPSGVLRHFSYASWQVEWSRNSLLMLYDLDLSSQYLRLGSFDMRSGPCLDNCW